MKHSKLFAAICFSLIFSIIMSFTLNATNSISSETFVYDNSIIIVEAENLTYEEMQDIANYIKYGTYEKNRNTRGLMCTLFGHDLETSTVREVNHNVYSTSPKCVENRYSVENCSRCDYIEKTLLDSSRVTCSSHN